MKKDDELIDIIIFIKCTDILNTGIQDIAQSIYSMQGNQLIVAKFIDCLPTNSISSIKSVFSYSPFFHGIP